MITAAKHRFSVKEYYRMAETGILPPNARVELLDGEIIDMSPIGPFHGGITNQLQDFFSNASKGRWITSVQNPVALDDHSEPQPDLMLLKRASHFYKTRHATPADVFLLIEVSDTTLDVDREQKLPAYAKAGIAEVWIVNVQEKVIEVHRKPHFSGYEEISNFGLGQHLAPVAFADCKLDVSALLNPF